MQKLILLFVIAMIVVQSAIINKNDINGPNNIVYYGEDNKINGEDN